MRRIYPPDDSSPSYYRRSFGPHRFSRHKSKPPYSSFFIVYGGFRWSGGRVGRGCVAAITEVCIASPIDTGGSPIACCGHIVSGGASGGIKETGPSFYRCISRDAYGILGCVCWVSGVVSSGVWGCVSGVRMGRLGLPWGIRGVWGGRWLYQWVYRVSRGVVVPPLRSQDMYVKAPTLLLGPLEGWEKWDHRGTDAGTSVSIYSHIGCKAYASIYMHRCIASYTACTGGVRALMRSISACICSLVMFALRCWPSLAIAGVD